ncbi:TetR/AcrR family transcriptional regulator [Anaeromicrobium sediminis]|uniref:HTH tetR-type domain-containing protein n=1 Tax=Anaeromicrobium sediminis TaxID=1478221 RepID=A0A267MKP2_9FIRM|nr:TetR/AcrR family transcriptional regulator [Anaeromicrobium sediminis]PAB60161.1 hypothetical protein CCE28_07260 [Anaeromicrobium sediminis]
MEFKRARTNAQIEERRKEILIACAEIFDKGDIDDVHFKAIGEKTSFARSTIYKYYTTKEEILLDLLLIDVMAWIEDVIEFTEKYEVLTKEEFCRQFTKSYVKNERLLRLMSILYSVLEKNCSLEKLTEFKRNLMGFMAPLYQSIQKFFPTSSDEAIQTFISTTSSYILGLYPSTHISEKQKEAIKQSGFEYEIMDFEEMCYKGFLLLSSVL